MQSTVFVFFFQAEDGIRDLVRSRGLGDVYKRQVPFRQTQFPEAIGAPAGDVGQIQGRRSGASQAGGVQDHGAEHGQIGIQLSLIHI